MSTHPDDDVRQTYGELRRQLAENGNPWTVDPVISDDEPLPQYPLGGLPEDSAHATRTSPVPAGVDVRALIAGLPPNDPGLRQRWTEVDLALDQVPEAGPGDRLENDTPAQRGDDSESDDQRARGQQDDRPQDAS